MLPLPFAGSAVYAVVYWVAVAVWVLPEMVSSRRKQSGDGSRDRGSMMLVIGSSFGGALLAVWLSLHVRGAAVPTHRVAIFYAGVAAILAGVGLRRYAMHLLGKSFTFDVAVREGQYVVEAGPYRFIRHPSYTGGLISAAGFGLMLGNWASLIAAPLCLFVSYTYRMRIEETALVDGLGETYSEYMKRTRRLVPFIY